MSQTERIFDILYRLSREGGYVRLSGISERFGISIRQAGRDIEYIRDRVLPDSSSLIYDRSIRAYRISDDADILSSWRERMILSLALYDASSSDTPGGHELSSSIPSSMRKVLSHVEYRENRRSLLCIVSLGILRASGVSWSLSGSSAMRAHGIFSPMMSGEGRYVRSGYLAWNHSLSSAGRRRSGARRR